MQGGVSVPRQNVDCPQQKEALTTSDLLFSKVGGVSSVDVKDRRNKKLEEALLKLKGMHEK